MPGMQVMRLRSVTDPAAAMQVMRLRSTSSGNGVRVMRLRSIGSGQMTIVITPSGDNQLVEPFDTVNIGWTVTGDVADSFSVVVSAAGAPTAPDPAVAVSVAGSSCTFKAPASASRQVRTVTITAHKAGVPDTSDTTTVTVRGHGGFYAVVGGVLTPRELLFEEDL